MPTKRIAFAIFACLLLNAAAQAEQKPNFLLIIADDLCWRDFGFTGNKDIKTPNIDRLAKDGLSTTTMFSPATTCSPSRHAMYTGLFCVRSGAYPNHTRVYEGTKSLFTHLKENGYRVALQNKSHVGPKASFPYEHIGSADNFDNTKDFITRSAKQPWFLAYASNDPHSPWNRGPKYDPDKIAIPSYYHDNATTRQMLAAHYGEISKLDEQVGQLMRLLEQTKQADNTLVMFVSEQGNSLPYGGKWTVYDNGIRVAMCVRWPVKIEPGSTTNALMQYVDIAPTFLEAAGIDPTKIDTGCPDADGDRGFDGRSLMKVLTGEAQEHRDYIFSQHTTVGINGWDEPYPMRAVRDDHYKLIRNLAPQNRYSIRGIHKVEPLLSWQKDAKDDPELARHVEWLFKRPAEELYDLQADPLETKNLTDDPKLADVKARLQGELDEWMRQQGDEGMKTELAARSRQGKGRQKKQPAKKKDN